VHCYWELRTAAPLDAPYTYPVVADGCIDLLFQADDPSQRFVMGFCDRCTAVPLGKVFQYAGIRFFPAIFPALAGIDAQELSGRFERLEHAAPGLALCIEQELLQPGSLHPDRFEAIASKFDRGLLSYLASRPSPEVDPRFAAALHAILERRGVLQVQTELDTGLSTRQLRRYFGRYVGGTAKAFSQVVRFQHVLHAQPLAQPLRQDPVFFDLGYYDQAHFIKEFKQFYGTTPGRVFGR
jgi:AraC-like DNA-binding protein